MEIQMIRKFTMIFSAAFLSIFTVAAQNTQKPLITSSSSVDWTKQEFSSQVLFNVEKAGIPMPSGKNMALDRITLEMPKLIKDQLLSLAVDSASDLGSVTMNQDVTLEQLAQIIENGHLDFLQTVLQ